MIADSVKFRGHRCFKNTWAGFSSIKPINVVIGKNNTGKSHLLDLASALCTDSFRQKDWSVKCTGILDETSLRHYFREDTSGGGLGGNHWENHGKHFLGVHVSWIVDASGQVSELNFPSTFKPKEDFGLGSNNERSENLHKICRKASHPLTGSKFRRLLADRDIRAEAVRNELELKSDGAGATNIIRRYIVSSTLSRELIQSTLLRALNQIFRDDGKFREIQVKNHDEEFGGQPIGSWEVFLGEEKKGLVPLCQSGSGLKTVILVLLNLLVIPEIEKKSKSEYVFAFEELENNLHPSLLRRLFQFLEAYAVEQKSTIFLTTHSSVALDLFGLSKNAQIVHVTHDGESAKAGIVSAHFDHLGVISELGAKPSDLLQANGIIWVEGPSDCIYLNRWIDLFSGGRWREGRDYQCAFYGGSLLARTQFASPQEAEAELVNLFRVNSNIVVICDGDRTSEGARIKDRVRRISGEVKRIPGAHLWVTGPREIESYLPGAVLSKVFGIQNVPDPGPYEIFFPREGGVAGQSFAEKSLNRKGIDKMDLAVQAAPHMTRELMAQRFDLRDQVLEVIGRIQSWNA